MRARRRLSSLTSLLVAALAAAVSGCASDEPPRREPAPAFPDITYEKPPPSSPAPGEADRQGADGSTAPPRRDDRAADPGGTKHDGEERAGARERPALPPGFEDDLPSSDMSRAPSASGPARLGPRPKARVLTGDVPPARRMRVHALDVGQGSATLFELPCAAILVDTGGEENEQWDGPAALTSALTRFFARRSDLRNTIALLVITHPHIDHVRGLPRLLSQFKVANVVDNGSDGDELVAEPMAALRSYVREAGGRVGYRAVTSDDVPRGGLTGGVIDPVACAEVDPEIRVLSGRAARDPGWGQDFYGHRRFENENNHSVVVRVDFGDASVLITGDLEDAAIGELVARTDGTGALDADLYVVGHHGSHNGTTRELLEEVTPDFAVISMGPADRQLDWTAWRYGHPRAGIVRLLDDMVGARRDPVTVPVARYGRRFDPYRLEAAVYGTGWDGTVVFEASSTGGFRVIETSRGEAKKTARSSGARRRR